MEEKKDFNDELVHLARLALSGRQQDIQLYIRRLANKARRRAPEIAEKLTALLIESPTRQAPVRSADVAMIPVDRDSRLQLVRIEYPVMIPVEPIWTAPLSNRLDQVIHERIREEALLKAGLAPTRSLLFTGPPGVGKTLAARWLAKTLDRPLVMLDLSAVMSSFLGRTGNNLRHVLDYAKSVPCILLLDEFDAIAKRRDDASEVGELKRLVTVLLQEIDDWPPNGILIAATNHSELLDPAIWRRFEMVLDFSIPSDDQISEAISQFLGPLPPGKESWRKALAVIFQGASFNDIEREVTRVRREAIISEKPIDECLLSLIQSRAFALENSKRRELALQLTQAGCSQRKAHEITGVSRDTVRKLNKANIEGIKEWK